MSMLNLRRSEKDKPENQQAKLPRATIPPAPPPPQRIYDPAALNFAQRLIDDQAEIERLKVELDTWRARALAAEEQVRRFEMRIDADRKLYDEHVAKISDHNDREIAKLSAARQHDVERLTEERDYFKLRHAKTVERLHVAGKIVLDALSADPEPAEIKPEPKIDMQAIAAELQRDQLPTQAAGVKPQEEALSKQE
jgi:hypothetical protein